MLCFSSHKSSHLTQDKSQKLSVDFEGPLSSGSPSLLSSYCTGMIYSGMILPLWTFPIAVLPLLNNLAPDNPMAHSSISFVLLFKYIFSGDVISINHILKNSRRRKVSYVYTNTCHSCDFLFIADVPDFL